MRALTIRQPSTSLIICGEKDVEKRTWTPATAACLPFRLASVSTATYSLATKHRARIDGVPRGAIIGVVELMDVVRDSSSRWAEPPCYHWVLSELRPIEPVAMRGRLGRWAPEVDLPA